MDTKDLRLLHKALETISKFSGKDLNDTLYGMAGAAFSWEDVKEIRSYIQEKIDWEKTDWEKTICRKCWGAGQVEIQSGPYYCTCNVCVGSGQKPKK